MQTFEKPSRIAAQSSGKRSATRGTSFNEAFSLVELSIVLVILGLLTGGILTGQSLIRAAELRSVTVEFQKYQTAVMTFRDKYFAIPGDMRNATDFWDAMTNCGAASPSGTGTETCDGNGDGKIDSASSASQTGELFGFWQHLANAGLIEGNYSGISGSNNDHDANVGVNVPISKISNAGFSAWNYVAGPGSNQYFAMDYGNFLIFGGESTILTEAGILRPEEAWNIDSKMDDGMPGTGKMIARPGGGYNSTILCINSTNATDYDATYKLESSELGCALIIKNAF